MRRLKFEIGVGGHGDGLAEVIDFPSKVRASFKCLIKSVDGVLRGGALHRWSYLFRDGRHSENVGPAQLIDQFAAGLSCYLERAREPQDKCAVQQGIAHKK